MFAFLSVANIEIGGRGVFLLCATAWGCKCCLIVTVNRLSPTSTPIFAGPYKHLCFQFLKGLVQLRLVVDFRSLRLLFMSHSKFALQFSSLAF